MFKRLIYEQWHSVVPIVSFALTGAVFLFVVVRSLLMRGETAERLAALPLQVSNEEDPTHV